MVKNAVLSLASSIRLDRLFYTIKRNYGYSTILSLHRVSDEPDFFWPPMSVGNFRKLLEYCATHYEISSLADLENRSSRPRLVFSFDDGYADFIENALPELNRFGFPSNHNVVIDCVQRNETIWTHDLVDIFSFLRKKRVQSLAIEGRMISTNGTDVSWKWAHQTTYSFLLSKKKEDRLKALKELRQEYNVPVSQVKMMNWQQVKHCAGKDVEIGSHTTSHHTLTTMGVEDLNRELADSRKIIEEHLGGKCDTLAVPNGQCDDNVMRTAAESGYKRLLLANDRLQARRERETISPIARITMVEESFSKARLRMEGFHHFAKNGRL